MKVRSCEQLYRSRNQEKGDKQTPTTRSHLTNAFLVILFCPRVYFLPSSNAPVQSQMIPTTLTTQHAAVYKQFRKGAEGLGSKDLAVNDKESHSQLSLL